LNASKEVESARVIKGGGERRKIEGRKEYREVGK
jgi:hypothetical protein